MKNEIIKLGIILCVITAIAAGLLGVVNDVTKPIIEEQERIANDNARIEILPDADEFKQLEGEYEGNIIEIYEGLSGGEVVGYTIKTTTAGYGGEFQVIVGIKNDGTISGVTMSNMNETPGLGAKAIEPAFKDQYIGKSGNELVVSKSSSGAENEIVAISGATITSNAVTVGVNEALAYFNNNLSK